MAHRTQVMSDESMQMELPCGTLHYASPELLRRQYTNKADMWSLGVQPGWSARIPRESVLALRSRRS